MLRTELSLLTLTVAVALALGTSPTLARVDVKVEFDKSFDFKSVRTWAWNPAGAGDVKMARTQEDDPAAMKRKAEPWILDAVAKETVRRKLQRVESEPDLTFTYYLLLSTNVSSQTMGQFLPGTVAWGLPLFPASTQSFEVVNRGSLVLDLSAAGTVVWRGVAMANIKMDADDKRRESLIREGVRDLLAKYPPKQ